MLSRESSRAFLNHVAMIESKIQNQNPNNLNKKVQLPATLFNRSPLRQRFGARCSPSKKTVTGLSPFRTRKGQTNMLGSGAQGNNYLLQQPAHQRVTSRQKQYEKRRGYCENHQTKPACFYGTLGSQTKQYCEKCAILLASKGVKVIKLDDRVKMLNSGGPQIPINYTVSDIENPIRRNQIGNFLQEIKYTQVLVKGKKQDIEEELSKNQDYCLQQEQIIVSYYGMLFNALEEHKSQMLMILAKNKADSEQSSRQKLAALDQANNQCEQMKTDILSSIDAIRKAEQKNFRPVMDMYKERSERLRNDSGQVVPQQIETKNLATNNVNDVAKQLLNSIDISFESNKYVQPVQTLRQKKNSVYFSFDRRESEDVPMMDIGEDELQPNTMQQMPEDTVNAGLE